MKILIISLPRTGSSNLLRFFRKQYKLIGEPFNYGIRKNFSQYKNIHDIIDTNNIVVKTHIHDIPVEIDKKFKSNVDFYSYFCEYFNKVILLNRKNKNELKESLTYAVKNNKHDREWHQPYFCQTTNIHKDIDLHIDDINNQMLKFSQVKEIPITWYEDIYSGNKDVVIEAILKWDIEIDIDVFMKHMNPSKRYRRFGHKYII